MDKLLAQIRKCTVCQDHLADGVNPVIAASKSSKIIIIGQAPGRAVHNTSIPWNDKSGDTLRKWLDIDKATFYNPDEIAIMAMSFCFPGKGKNGDLPPRRECADLWHQQLLSAMPDVKLTLLIGQYAQKRYLGKQAKNNLTETIKNFEEYLPNYFPLPHPSGRNNIWQAKNPWFKQEVLPTLKIAVQNVLHST